MSEKELKSFFEEYLILKGINPKKNIRCFSKKHEDKHPSMSFWKKGNICNCFACGEKYNIFKLVGQEYNLTTKEEQIKKVEELYYNRDLIKDINETIYSQKNATVPLEYTKMRNPESKKTISKNYDYYFKNCKKRIETCNYLKERGISKGVINEYNIGYDPKFKQGTWEAVIIPTSHHSFTARNIDEFNPDNYRKIGNSHLFGEWKLDQLKDERFYIVEGEMDLLSLATIKKNAVALGSVYNINLLIDKLKKVKNNHEYILMFDTDEKGQEWQKVLYKKMKDLNLDVKISYVLGNYKDPNEFLVKDKKGFLKKLDAYEKSLSKNIKKNPIKIKKKRKTNEGNER